MMEILARRSTAFAPFHVFNGWTGLVRWELHWGCSKVADKDFVRVIMNMECLTMVTGFIGHASQLQVYPRG